MQTPQALSSTPSTPTPLLVACLCADWCDTCRRYQTLFADTGAEFPGLHFVWIDIEDDANVVDPIEVENFPTLLVATAEHALFFGTVTPHIATLQRLVQTLSAANTPPALLQRPELDELAQRVWQSRQR